MSDQKQDYVPAHAAPNDEELSSHDEQSLTPSVPALIDTSEQPIGAHAAPAGEQTIADPEEGLEEALFEQPLENYPSFVEFSQDPAVPVPLSEAGEDEMAHSPSASSEELYTSQADSDEPGPSPEDTAEIDVTQIEAQLADPGNTQSFEALSEERIDTASTFDAGTTCTLMWGARSDVGCVRSHNEDSYLAASPLFAVCDGMGGHAAGEVASAIAVETIAKTAPTSADPALLAASIEAANAAIIDAAAHGTGKPGMGCTATAAYVEDTTVAIAHVGDSRAYLLHEHTLIRVTRDHSFVEELVDAGEITADEARVHPNRSVITRALGSDPAMYADHFQLNIEQGDRLILCSDGLSSMIPDSEIEAIALKSETAQMCTDNLVDAALAAGGGDNVSVVVVDIVDDGRVERFARRRRRNILIGGIAALVIAITIVIAMVASISSSVYLGVNGDTVAIYSGVPGSFLGIELSHIYTETSIELADLPQDTQSRLKTGIPQESIEEAKMTLNNYRRQIDEEQTEQEQNAAAIRNSAESNTTDSAAPAVTPQSEQGGA